MEKEVAVTAVAAVVSPLIQKIANAAKQHYYNYSNSNLNEIENIRQYYRLHCQPIERESKLTTIRAELQPEEADENQDFPIYFQMNKKQPVFFQKKLRTIKNSAEWERYVNSQSLMSTYIKDMINLVCNYQIERNKGLFKISDDLGIGGKGYSYDPTNLFFEEFKMWLVELSKAPVNEDTLKVVECRIDYFRALDINEVFKQSGKDTTRHKTIIELNNLLEGKIRPIINASMALEGSREHFQSLRINLQNIIREVTKFTFYILRHSKYT